MYRYYYRTVRRLSNYTVEFIQKYYTGISDEKLKFLLEYYELLCAAIEKPWSEHLTIENNIYQILMNRGNFYCSNTEIIVSAYQDQRIDSPRGICYCLHRSC